MKKIKDKDFGGDGKDASESVIPVAGESRPRVVDIVTYNENAHNTRVLLSTLQSKTVIEHNVRNQLILA